MQNSKLPRLKSLQKTYKLAAKLFPGISKICNQCNTCCRTYGWVLKDEAEYLLKEGYRIITINNDLFCIDSFKRDKKGEFIVDKIPQCVFYRQCLKIRFSSKSSNSVYKNKYCVINNIKPLDCRLYPIKVRFRGSQAYIGVSLGCQYVASLTSDMKNTIHKNIIDFFIKAPKDITNNYLDMLYQVNLITKPKKFWMKEILKAIKEENFWKLEKLRY